METLDAIYQRRAVKHFDTEHRLTADEELRLLEAAIQSPTSFNMQNWRFVIIKDSGLRQEICAAAHDQAQVVEASLLMVLTADLKAWKRNPQRYWQHAPPEVNELLSGWMGPFYEGDDRLQRDEAMRSVGIAAQTLMLAAKAMGYDSCPMIGFDAGKVSELIRLPDNHVVGILLTIGRAVKPAWPKPGQLPLSEVVVTNTF